MSLCAGELDAHRSESRRNADPASSRPKAKRRWAVTRSKARQQILGYYNDYFGVPYPLPKLDQIALPGRFWRGDGELGRDHLLRIGALVRSGKILRETKQNIFEVIAHEMAHMWFGDLVTMAWWDNLWLNEGFASWMGTKCTAHFNPQWEVWLSRNFRAIRPAGSESPKNKPWKATHRSTTHPIQQPIADRSGSQQRVRRHHLQKGQSFIRMLESFLGEEVFRDGIRRYMTAHKFSNTTTADLWNALSEASGKPVG